MRVDSNSCSSWHYKFRMHSHTEMLAVLHEEMCRVTLLLYMSYEVCQYRGRRWVFPPKVGEGLMGVSEAVCIGQAIQAHLCAYL